MAEHIAKRAQEKATIELNKALNQEEDIAQTAACEMMEKIAESLKTQEEARGKGHSRQNSNSSVVSVTSMEVGSITSKYTGNSPADLHGMWYPPVRRTLLTLSKLYRCLEIPIFTSLSQV